MAVWRGPRRLTDSVSITPIGPFRTKLRPPGSKSLTNRALLLGALAHGESVLDRILIADDTRQMIAALRALGFQILLDETHRRAHITGLGGLIPPTDTDNVSLHLGNAGTAYRFLTAACCLGDTSAKQAKESGYRLDGIERMHHRPIGQLVDALRQLGAQINYIGRQGFPPLQVFGTGLQGGSLEMPPTLSSQYISALLQVAPYCKHGITIRFTGPITSQPYVRMTLELMTVFGSKPQVEPEFKQIHIPPGRYGSVHYQVEPDASSASYFLAAAAMIPGSQCTIEGLGKHSLQGDVGFADVLHQMGAGLLFGDDFITVIAPPEPLRGIDIDLNAMPDMAQTLAVVAIFAEGTTTIRNIGNLRIKETDRMDALCRELTKLGAQVTIDGDDLIIHPSANSGVAVCRGATIDTYDDHRMAMSFALAGLKIPGVVIRDPGCVDKTFPDFFQYLSGLGKSE